MPVLSVEEYGAAGDGSDDSAAFNAATAALGTGGGTILLNSPVYGIGAPISGMVANIRIVSNGGFATLVKLPTGGYGSFCHVAAGGYLNYTFERIHFDGNRDAVAITGVPGYTFHFQNQRGATFLDCEIRDASSVYFGGSQDITFRRCRFFGTRSGRMAGGVMDPPAVGAATYGTGLALAADVHNVVVDDCSFHYLVSGLGQNNVHGMNDRLHVTNCVFRADWWNAPYVTRRFVPDAYANGTLTLNAGGLSAVTGGLKVLSFRYDIASGASLLNIYASVVKSSGAVFGGVREGDVLELADGTRGEVSAVAFATELTIRGWERQDTFEPAAAPQAAQAWRISRYYASATVPVSDTQVGLYIDPIQAHTGERLVADSGRSPLDADCRALAEVVYSGMHISKSQRNLLVQGCRFRGHRADACSSHNNDGPQILGNYFEFNHEEDITLTFCPHSAVIGNHFHRSGSSPIFTGHSDYSIFANNVIFDWAATNRAILGAIDGNLRHGVITGNSFSVETTPGMGGASACCISLYGDSSADTLISDNVDAGARQSTLNVDAASGAVRVRDVATVTGAGNANVVHLDVASAQTFDYTTNLKLRSLTLPNNGAQDGKALCFRNAADTADLAQLSAVGGDQIWLKLLSAVNFSVTGPGGPYLRVGNDGLIGCGTASPGGVLHVLSRSAGQRGLIAQGKPGQVSPVIHVWDSDGRLRIGMLDSRISIYNVNQPGSDEGAATYERMRLQPISNRYRFSSEAGGAGTAARDFEFTGGNVRHSGFIATSRTSEPADAELGVKEVALWFDEEHSALGFKARRADGTIVRNEVALS